MSSQELNSLFENSNILLYVAFFFFCNIAIIFIEIIIDLITSRQRRWKDTGANIIIYFFGLLLEKIGFGSIAIICLLPFYYFTSFEIPMNGWTWTIGIFAADFTYYWMHRFEHKYRILWANHSVHHSSEDYNLTVSMRLSIIEGAIEWIFLIPMVLLGFNPFQTIICLVFVAQYQTWIHTEKIIKLSWLDEVFNTPSIHRVHHGSNDKYLDRNYGGILIVWDKLFGTFQREEEKVVYGLTKNIDSNNPITINFIEYKNIWTDLKKCRNWVDRYKIVFGDLKWRPEYFNEAKIDKDEIWNKIIKELNNSNINGESFKKNNN